MTFALIAASFVLASIGLFFAGKSLAPDWKEDVPWDKLIGLSSVIATLVSVGFYAISEMLLPSIAVFLVTWVTPTIIYTDYTKYLIPKKISDLAIILLLPLPIIAAIMASSWIPLLVTGLFLILPIILVFSQGIGMGDLRLLVMFSLALPWWTGFYSMIIGMFIAIVVQLITYIIARVLGKGKIRTIKTLIRKREKQRRSTPFGPALLLGFLIVAIWAGFAEPIDCSAAITCLDTNLLR